MSFRPQYLSSPPVLTNQQYNNGLVDQNGNLLVSMGAGSAIVGKVGLDQTTPGTTNGVVVNRTPTSTSTLTSVASSATSVTILAANTARKGASISNTSTAILYLRLNAGTADITTGHTVQMASNTYFEVPFGYTGAIVGIWASANGSANVTEFA